MPTPEKGSFQVREMGESRLWQRRAREVGVRRAK